MPSRNLLDDLVRPLVERAWAAAGERPVRLNEATFLDAEAELVAEAGQHPDDPPLHECARRVHRRAVFDAANEALAIIGAEAHAVRGAGALEKSRRAARMDALRTPSDLSDAIVARLSHASELPAGVGLTLAGPTDDVGAIVRSHWLQIESAWQDYGEREWDDAGESDDEEGDDGYLAAVDALPQHKAAALRSASLFLRFRLDALGRASARALYAVAAGLAQLLSTRVHLASLDPGHAGRLDEPALDSFVAPPRGTDDTLPTPQRLPPPQQSPPAPKQPTDTFAPRAESSKDSPEPRSRRRSTPAAQPAEDVATPAPTAPAPAPAPSSPLPISVPHAPPAPAPVPAPAAAQRAPTVLTATTSDGIDVDDVLLWLQTVAFRRRPAKLAADADAEALPSPPATDFRIRHRRQIAEEIQALRRRTQMCAEA